MAIAFTGTRTSSKINSLCLQLEQHRIYGLKLFGTSSKTWKEKGKRKVENAVEWATSVAKLSNRVEQTPYLPRISALGNGQIRSFDGKLWFLAIVHLELRPQRSGLNSARRARKILAVERKHEKTKHSRTIPVELSTLDGDLQWRTI